MPLSDPLRIRLDGEEFLAHYLLYQSEIEYPAGAKTQGIQGDVLLKVIVSTTGRVQSVSAISGESVLAESAVNGLQKWVWRPVTVNGKPVEVVTELQVPFRLNDN